MNDQIVCPHCKKNIPLSEALTHQIQERNRQEREDDRKRMNIAAQKWRQEQLKKMEEEKLEKEKEIMQRAKEQIEKEIKVKLLDDQNAREDLEKQNKAMQEQLLETNKLIRQLRNENAQKNLELEKKLAEEEEKIKLEARKQSDEANRLNILAMEKKLSDALKVNDELKRKLEQGSQQTQGEVLELELENILRTHFPFDEIRPVAKGVRGGDIVQIVKNSHGTICGTILWESKRTKAWSKEWLTKLKDDQRQVKAEIAVLITQVLPETVKKFGWLEGICVGDYDCISGIGYVVRNQLIEISLVKLSLNGKQDKMEILFSYLTGTEFRHRVAAIVEAFSTLQDDIEKEKRWFAAKWSKQERNIRKVMDNTLGMQGDLQSIVGKELPEITDSTIVSPKVELETATEDNQLF